MISPCPRAGRTEWPPPACWWARYSRAPWGRRSGSRCRRRWWWTRTAARWPGTSAYLISRDVQTPSFKVILFFFINSFSLINNIVYIDRKEGGQRVFIENLTKYDVLIRSCCLYSGGVMPFRREGSGVGKYKAKRPKQGSKRFNFITRTIHFAHLGILFIYVPFLLQNYACIVLEKIAILRSQSLLN